MLTPLDIQNAAFHRSFRGYNEKEVDDFLDRIVIEYEHMYRESLELRQRLTALQEAAPARPADAEREVTGKQAMLSLAGFPEAGPRNAQPDTESENRLQAEREAERILAEARDEATRIRGEAQERLALDKARLEEVRRQYRLFSAQFRAMLTSYYRMLGQAENASGVQADAELEGLYKEAAAAGLD